MAKLGDLLKFSGKEEREIMRLLQRLEKEKTPIRIEIEGSNIRFYSILSLKRGLVVVAKPPGLKAGIDREGKVRFRLPGEDSKELRLEVTVPHFNLLSGGYVFLCKVPTTFAESSNRVCERYNTSRFNNLFLDLPTIKGRFRIIDISQEGCKVFTEKTLGNKAFDMGQTLTPASISVGNKVDIELQGAVPRSHHRNTVGFELHVENSGPSGKYLSHFLKSLDAAESTTLRVDPA